jgi:hypothetical protein
MYLFRPRLTFLAEAQPRRESVTLNFLGDRTNYKAKDIIGIITNLCCIYLFQIYKFINTYILLTIFLYLANKTRNLLFARQLLIYIIYGDRTIIGFVGFVANLLNISTDGATVTHPKKSYFSSACEYLRKIAVFIKGA